MRQHSTVAGLLFAAAVGCAPNTSPSGRVSTASQSAQIDGLIAALDTVQGEFRDVADLTFVFMSDSHVLEELATYDEAAVIKLVDCLSRPHLVRATVEHSGHLRLGTLCYEALAYTDYFQARPKWFVDSVALTFNAEPKELRHAQRVWRAYLKENPLGP
jgi:hypothetical protein